MPISWQPKINRIRETIAREENKIRTLQQGEGEYKWPPDDDEEEEEVRTPPTEEIVEPEEPARMGGLEQDFFKGLFGPMEWARGQVGQILTAPWRPRTTEPTWQPPTEEEKARGIFAYQPSGAREREYEEWQAPGFEFEPAFRLPWTPEEIREKPWRVDVKGVAEELPILPFYLAGGAGAGRTIFRQAEKILRKQAMGKTISAAEQKILEKARLAEQAIIKRIEPAIRGEAGMMRLPETKIKPPKAEAPIPTLANKLPYLSPELTPYKARKQIKLVANELTEHLGIPPAKPTPLITRETMKQNVWNRVGEKAEGFVNRTYRVENILLRADKYVDGGKMWQAFWRPVEEATNRQVSRLYNRHDIFRRTLKKNNIDLGKWLNQTVETAGIKLTPFERIGLYLHSRNTDNLVHMVFGNNIPADAIPKIVASLTPEERLVANFFAKFYTGQTPIMQAVTRQVTGKSMTAVENYFPLQLQRKAMEMMDFNQFVISEVQLRGASKWASARVRKGFTLPRTGKAMQPVELDALSVWMRHLEGTEHYKAFAPVIRDLQRLMANGQLRFALTNSQGKHVVQVMEQWLKDVAMTNPLAVRNQFEAFARTMRVNAVTAVLGTNILTALKQFPSFFAGMAEVGTMPVVRGLFTYLQHPKQTMSLIRRYAPQIYKRRFEREIAEAAAMRGIAGRITGKMSPRQVFMLMTTSMDRLAVNSIWRGAWDDALKKGMTTKEAGELATRAIRRTQPYFGIKDVPEYWRSGELAKALTIFTNQLNQYWNYYRFHILGKRLAGKISNYAVAKKMIETFIVPALTIGAITRSEPAQDIGEFATDLVSMGFATVPIFGNWITSGIRGFTSSGLITTELLDKIRQLAYSTNKEAWDRVAKTLPQLAGFAVGVPVSQPARTLQAIWDIAQGKTDDWMELIWGAYVRREAEEERGVTPGGRPSTPGKYKWPP